MADFEDQADWTGNKHSSLEWTWHFRNPLQKHANNYGGHVLVVEQNRSCNFQDATAGISCQACAALPSFLCVVSTFEAIVCMVEWGSRISRCKNGLYDFKKQVGKIVFRTFFSPWPLHPLLIFCLWGICLLLASMWGRGHFFLKC